jgi:glycosyltransferase involved in cell wall biosynthesis
VNQKKDPVVSIVMPTFNRAHLLPRAIKSVLHQTYQQFELIIVDDGSSDNTPEVIKSFTDPRINYIRFNDNRGQSIALNEGLNASKGLYITFLDDDDEFFPHTLEKEVTALEKAQENINFVVGLGIKLKKNKISYFNEKGYHTRAELFKAQLQFCALSLAGVLLKRKCIKEIGPIDETFVLGNDWDFMLRVLKKFDYKYINILVYKAHYEESANISHICVDSIAILPRRLETYKLFVIKHLQEIKQCSGILAKYYFRIAQILYHYKKFILSNRYFKLAFQNRPIHLRYLFYYLISQFRNTFYFLYLLEQRILQKLEKNIL